MAHDDDDELAMRALFSLGVVGAGTNNSRIAALLRNLGIYYQDETKKIFIIKIALGFLHAGKGLITINPYH